MMNPSARPAADAATSIDLDAAGRPKLVDRSVDAVAATQKCQLFAGM